MSRHQLNNTMDTNPGLSWERPRSLKDFILERGCQEYEELVALRNECFRDELLNRNFGSDARRQRHGKYKTDEHWLKVGCSTLKQIDNKLHCIPGASDDAIHFLDLGCCPGGFSKYILSKNPRVQGIGISLDPKYGGYGLAIPYPQRERYKMNWADLTYLVDCSPRNRPAPTGAVTLSQTPFPTCGFQLIILDGVYPEPTVQELNSTHPWDMDRLLIAQLIIALEYIDRGGTLLVKLNHLESVITAQLVYMLDKFSKRLVVFKPYTHAKQASFYAIVTGVGLGWEWKRRESILENLKEVWWKLTYGDDSNSEGRYLKEEDLNFIVTFETLKGSYLARLIRLGRGPWRLQSQALRRAYEQIRLEAATRSSDSENDAPKS